jgi:hypothetical protein
MSVLYWSSEFRISPSKVAISWFRFRSRSLQALAGNLKIFYIWYDVNLHNIISPKVVSPNVVFPNVVFPNVDSPNVILPYIVLPNIVLPKFC